MLQPSIGKHWNRMDYSSLETPISTCWGNYHLSAFAQPQSNLRQKNQLWNSKISFSQMCLKPSKPLTEEGASILLFQSGLVFLRLSEVTHCHQVKINYYFSLEKPQCIHSATLCSPLSCCIWYAQTDFHLPLWLNFNQRISTQNFSAVREKSEPYLYI